MIGIIVVDIPVARAVVKLTSKGRAVVGTLLNPSDKSATVVASVVVLAMVVLLPVTC